jgi:muramoyltetrapeptide carboxypeptidase
MLDDSEIKAVFSVRGGYGSVRIIDQLDFSGFMTKPKWFVGYSDVTVFHAHINHVCGVQTLHATMPLNFANNTKDSLSGLFDVLKGALPAYKFENHLLNRGGNAEAVLTGGNLSVLFSLLGSRSFPVTEGNILFIEDLDEYLYHVDRMMMALSRAGILSGLKGLIVGGMTDMNDNEIPFGKTAEQIIREAVESYDFPVCFGFPAGHFDNNLPLIMGAEIRMEVAEETKITFTK